MNGDLKEYNNTEYTLDDAFELIKSSLGDSYQIINSIILSQKQKYEDIINSMNKKIVKLNSQLERLKKENYQLKNMTVQLQDKLLSLSQMLKQLSKEENDNQKSDMKFKNLKQNNLYRNKNKIKEIHTDIAQESIDNKINNQNFNKKDNNFINNEIFNLDKQTIDLDRIKKSINHQIFNKKFKLKKEKTFTKGFNLSKNDTTPTRILQKDSNLYIKENESQSSNSLENNYIQQQSNTISNVNHARRKYNNLGFKTSITHNENNSEKFNAIAKKIKHLKNGLSINNLENNNENNIRFYTTYSIKRRNYSNLNDLNTFDNE